MLLSRPLRFIRLAPPEFVRATWWGWYLRLYSIKNNFGEGLGHLRDTTGLQGYVRKLGNDPRNYSLSAISVRAKLLPVEGLDLVFLYVCLC